MANEQPTGEGKEEPPPLGRSAARRLGIAPLLLGRHVGGESACARRRARLWSRRRDPPALGAMAEEPTLGVAAARSTASSPEKAAASSREPCEARPHLCEAREMPTGRHRPRPCEARRRGAASGMAPPQGSGARADDWVARYGTGEAHHARQGGTSCSLERPAALGTSASVVELRRRGAGGDEDRRRGSAGDRRGFVRRRGESEEIGTGFG